MLKRIQKTIDVTMTRALMAAPEEVFDDWLDPASPASVWFGSVRTTVNPEVGGLFYHVMRFEGHDWAHYGRFIALERPRRIQQTWVSEATRGLESVITVTLEAEKKNTRLTLHHANLPDDELGASHKGGWDAVLGGLAERLEKRRAAEKG